MATIKEHVESSEQMPLDKLLDTAHAIGERAAAQAIQAERECKLDDHIR